MKLKQKKNLNEGQVKSSNLNHLHGILSAAETLPHVTAVLQPFNISSSDKSKLQPLVIDLVCQNGNCWVKVIARKAQALHLVWAGQGQYGERNTVHQAEEYLSCAARNPNNYTCPKVVFLFLRGVTVPMARALRKLGILVHGDEVQVHPDIAQKLADISISDDEQNAQCVLAGQSSRSIAMTSDSKSCDLTSGSRPSDLASVPRPFELTSNTRSSDLTPDSRPPDLTLDSRSPDVISRSRPSNLALDSRSHDLTSASKSSDVIPRSTPSNLTSDSRSSESAADSRSHALASELKSSALTSDPGASSATSVITMENFDEEEFSESMRRFVIRFTSNSNLSPVESYGNLCADDFSSKNISRSTSEDSPSNDSETFVASGLSSHCNTLESEFSAVPRSEIDESTSFKSEVKTAREMSLTTPGCDSKSQSLSAMHISSKSRSTDLSTTSLRTLLPSAPTICAANLDITTLIAMVSNLTHGGCDLIFKEAILTDQATGERRKPLMPILNDFLKDKELYSCESAVTNFQTILKTVAGPSERRRADELLAKVKVVPDCPSEKAKQLRLTGHIRQRSMIIFGTGDHIQAVTVTANVRFVYGAKDQGVNFVVFPHESRALTERKEATAIPFSPIEPPVE